MANCLVNALRVKNDILLGVKRWKPFLVDISDIYVYIYMHACNLIWWAVLGLQDVMKLEEIRRNKEKQIQRH